MLCLLSLGSFRPFVVCTSWHLCLDAQSSWVFPCRFPGSCLVSVETGMKVAVALAGQGCKMHSAVKGVEIQKPEPNGKPHLGC